jgi:hypothetical protein
VSAVADTLCLACTLTPWRGEPHLCRWCCDPLPQGRERWCSRTCMEEWRENHVWKYAREAVRRRDGNRCVACLDRTALPHIHHVRPCQGTRTASCLHHLANLETLCAGCHQDTHREVAA